MKDGDREGEGGETEGGREGERWRVVYIEM